jgi:hypothetical protein
MKEEASKGGNIKFKKDKRKMPEKRAFNSESV